MVSTQDEYIEYTYRYTPGLLPGTRQNMAFDSDHHSNSDRISHHRDSSVLCTSLRGLVEHTFLSALNPDIAMPPNRPPPSLLNIFTSYILVAATVHLSQ